jgi:hypothetical protein
MADIDVVKKSSRTWLWVIIALAIVIAALFLLGRNPDTQAGLMYGEGGRPLAAALHVAPSGYSCLSA